MTGFIIGMAVGVLITYMGTLIGEWKFCKRYQEEELNRYKYEQKLMEEKLSSVRFYIATDANGTQRLFLDKPTLFRNATWYATKKGILIANNEKIAQYGIDLAMYKGMTVKDEPKEVKITLEGEE